MSYTDEIKKRLEESTQREDQWDDLTFASHYSTDIKNLLEEREVLREALKIMIHDKRASGFPDEDINELKALAWEPSIGRTESEDV